ncbi:uncharacterized protein CEXT_64781 [Caerostris extrusa]|uniref:Uncharacterized protein n=1 Tax=Caerostris extrusa TaxID=172846 RepID=A0AAV4X9X0_CAEEX|nr:uncharacterized protein CEXT_64781 [Caerostris extrusa]
MGAESKCLLSNVFEYGDYSSNEEGDSDHQSTYTEVITSTGSANELLNRQLKRNFHRFSTLRHATKLIGRREEEDSDHQSTYTKVITSTGSANELLNRQLKRNFHRFSTLRHATKLIGRRFTSTTASVGLSLYSFELEGDLYLNFFVSAGAEVAAAAVVIVVIGWCGRRCSFCLSSALGGALTLYPLPLYRQEAHPAYPCSWWRNLAYLPHLWFCPCGRVSYYPSWCAPSECG